MLRTLTLFIRRMSRLATIYCVIAILTHIWSASPYIAVLVILFRFARRKKARSTTLGSAAFATESELDRTGMLGAANGLILGPLWERNTFVHRRLPLAVRQRHWVRLSGATHTAIFAPSNAGKSTSLVITNLLTNPESVIVADFKGELAGATAAHRKARFGHRVVCLDPYRIYTDQPDTLNPLDSIPFDHPLGIDDAQDLAASLVVRTGHETDPHWGDTSEAVIAAVTATTISYGEKNSRSLHTVRDIIANPIKLDTVTKLMLESDRWNGALNQMGGQLQGLVDKERASVISTALRHLKFLGTPTIFESTSSSTFSPAELRQGKMTVFLILPPDRATALSGLLRMWVSALLRACVKGGLQ